MVKTGNVGISKNRGFLLSQTPLGNAGTFTQTAIDRAEKEQLDGYCYLLAWSDQAGTLYLEESEDGTNYTTTKSVAVAANVTTELPVTKLSSRYFRAKYVNGSTPQTKFVLVQGLLGKDDEVLMGSYATKTATIALGTSLSTAIKVQGFKFFTLIMPAAWDAAAMSFQGSDDGVTYYDLYSDGGEVSETVVAGKAYVLNQNALIFASIPYIKIRSGLTAAAVNQTALRTLKLVCSY